MGEIKTWGVMPGYLGRSNIITRVLVRGKHQIRARDRRRRCDNRVEWEKVLGCRAKDQGSLSRKLGVGASHRSSPTTTLTSATYSSFQTYDLRSMRGCLCCYNPQSLRQLIKVTVRELSQTCIRTWTYFLYTCLFWDMTEEKEHRTCRVKCQFILLLSLCKWPNFSQSDWSISEMEQDVIISGTNYRSTQEVLKSWSTLSIKEAQCPSNYRTSSWVLVNVVHMSQATLHF